MRFEDKPVIGMIHVPALPGTPDYVLGMKEIRRNCSEEAGRYARAGIDAIMIENMHDLPYVKKDVGPEITAAMAVLAADVRAAAGGVPVGVQVLAGANRAAVAVAKAGDGAFVRVEGYVFGHVADEGYIDGCAGDLLRYRRAIGAGHVTIWADIKKKHCSHAVTADLDIVATALAAQFFKADALIVTGSVTGEAPAVEDLAAVKKHVSIPVIIGSGMTIRNIGEYFLHADAFIVGSWMKEDGDWRRSVDEERAAAFMEKVKNLRRRNG
ncbi:BtpA/SgcQ family protein [bacterium]|nr:BtpA/SgcQ family protein [candidate division CSSED10-310 bacterium]